MIKRFDNIILTNLNQLIGQQIDTDDIICCFPGEERVIISEIEGATSNYDRYGECQLYNAYYDDVESTIFNLYVGDNSILVDVF